MVFLHELAHVRRGDIALNWAMILVRSLHWFNPLVWLAMKRLRADRELVCDAMVMARLSPGEHRVYGGTLIKLLDDFSGAESCPSRVPVINNKSEIKRRVTMIAKFKSPGRAAVLASAAVVVVLCAFTFTRAAEKKVKSGKGDAAAFDPYFVQTVAARTNQVEHWKQKLAELEGRIAVAQDEVDAWGPVSSRIAEDRSESGLHPDIIRRLESERISTDANYRGLAELLHQLRALKEKGGNELKKSILSAHPDAQLAKLLDDLWTTEAKMAQLKTTHGPEHVELKAIAETQAILSAKVNERIEGILSGLEVRAAAAKAQRDSLMQSIQEVKIKDTQGTTQYRSYLQARRNLENLQKVRDALYLKILELEYGVAAPKSDVK
jgi:hypothetical protein